MATSGKSEQLSHYWHEQITAWEASGQTQKSFCEQHDLDYHRFGYWKRKFKELASINATQDRRGFVTVRPAVDSEANGLILALPNGIRILGIAESNLSVVAQLLRQL
jgi:transposase